MGNSCCSSRNDLYRSFYHQESQQFFDKFTLGHKLGKGSSGEVKIAYHNITHKKVAVKIFDKAEIIKSQKFQSIMSQKLILEQLSLYEGFLFISHLIQCSQDRFNLYLVLKYFKNGNLRKLIKTKKTFNSQQLQFITICLLLTLKFLHNRGIIHGDIKPQNILIDRKGYFCVVDFSSAKYYGCQNTDLRGTRGYQAPQLTVQNPIKLLDNKSDLYSLGLILWQIAYGMPYWQYKNNERKISASFQGTSDSISDNSVNCIVEDLNFNNFIELLLKQNPAERPSIQKIMTHSWLNFSESKKQMFIQRKVTPNPFQPIQAYFTQENKQSLISLQKSQKDSSQCQDQLYRSVLLNQSKYQQMFSQFNCKSKINSNFKSVNRYI